MATPTIVEAAILRILAQGRRCGRDIDEAYRQLTADALKPGTLYTTLDRMAAKGWISVRVSDPNPHRRGRPRRQYRILTTGRRVFAAYRLRALRIVSGL